MFRKILRIGLKTILWIAVSVIVLLLLITVLIRIPAVQTFVVHKATSFVSAKTKTRIEVGYLGINFPNSVVLEGVFAEDLSHDTLVNIRRLEVNVDMLALFNSTLYVRNLELDGATIKLRKTLPDSTFNFQFLIDAFASKDSVPKEPQDTSGGGFKIRADELKLTNTSFLFDDSVEGSSFSTRAGLLHVTLDEIDLDSMMFAVDEITVENTHAWFIVSKSSVQTEATDTAVSALPRLSINSIKLNQSSFRFQNKPDTADFSFSMAELEVVPKTIDLNNMWIELEKIRVEKPVSLMTMHAANKEEGVPANALADTATGWQVKVTSAELVDGYFKMDMMNVPRQKSGMDYSHLHGQQINVDLRDAFYSSKLIKGYLKNASLNEQCGLQLKKLSTRFVYDDQHAELAALRVETPRTTIINYIGVTYPSVSQIGERLGEVGITANLKNTKVHLADVLYFAPDLIRQPPFNGNANKLITANGKLNGQLNDLSIGNFIITAGEQTAIQFNGHVKGLPDAEKAWFDIHLQTFTTTEADLNNLVGAQYLPQQIRIPEHVMLRANYKGGIKSFVSDLNLETTEGNATVKAVLNMNPASEEFNLDAALQSLNLGYILKNTSLGRTTGNIKGKGKNFDPEKMVATVNADIRSVFLAGYTYQDIKLDADANKGKAKAALDINDKNIMLTLDASGDLKKDSEQVDVFINLVGANMRALGLSKDDLRTGAQVRASVKGFSPDVMDGYLGIGNLQVASPGYRYKFDSMVVTTINDPGKHMLDINSSVLAARYEGSLSLDKVATAIQEHLNYYMKRDSKMPDTTSGDFTFMADVKPHPVFSDLVLPDLKRFSGININTSYSSLTRKLEVKVNSPQIIYDQYNIRDLSVNVNSNASSMTYELAVSAVESGMINLPKTTVSGNIANGVIDNTTRIIEKDSGDRLLIRNDIQMKDGTTIIAIKDGKLVLDNKTWTVPEDNKITIAPGGINIRNLLLENSGNRLTVQSETTTPGAPMDVKFINFNLGELSQIIENDTPLVRGALNGNLHIQKTAPFEFTSDLTINDVVFQNIPVGEVSIQADNLTANRYTAKLQLKGNDNDVVVKGYYENEVLNMDADVNSITMKTLEAFAPSQLRDAKGYLSGHVSVSGKASKPDIKGNLRFNDADMILVAINNRITISRETVSVDEKGIHFGRFTVKDQSGQPLVLSGDVFTTDFMNMKFNIDIRTQNFTVINTTSRNSKEYYGKMIVNSNIKVRGTQDLPIIDANVKLIEGSSFTYVVQQGDLSTDIGEDVVQVIDKDTNIFFKFADTLLSGSSFKGIDLSANIEVDRRTVFTVIVDPSSGDKLVVAGDAILNFSLDQSGKMSLAGTYTLNDGSYRASFQKVVKKEFFIQSGSRITWAGDPTGAKIGITAVYKVRTSAVDLLAADVSAEERNTYRKLLDYEVHLIITGELLKPELAFRIQLDEDDRNAFGGLVESKLNTVNNDPNELNKQVFALLILNKFLPPSNATAASSSSNVARNSVNQVLSDQLNALSGRYIKGGELNFNIQSNDEYGGQGSTATQENTEVEVNYKQQLFNERLSVQVGGNVNVNDNSPQATSQQNITGDVVVEYKITDDGRYRFKAFRENNYEGLIDGMLYKTGVGIMYSRDYDSVKELLSPPKKEEEQDITKDPEKKRKKNRKKRPDKKENDKNE